MRKLNENDTELLAKIEEFIRASISEEQDATMKYVKRKRKVEEMIEEIEDEELKKKLEIFAYTFNDIQEEEEVHIGQFRKMLSLFGISHDKEKEGEDEAEQDIEKFEPSNSIEEEMPESFSESLIKLKNLVEYDIDNHIDDMYYNDQKIYDFDRNPKEKLKNFESKSLTFDSIEKGRKYKLNDGRILTIFNLEPGLENEGYITFDIDGKFESGIPSEEFDRLFKGTSFKSIKEAVQIPVKHPGLLNIPSNKKFWQLPLSHYEQLVKDKGYSKIIKALNNLKVWNKNDDPSIAKKADAIMNKLEKKHKSKKENFNTLKNIKNQLTEIIEPQFEDYHFFKLYNNYRPSLNEKENCANCNYSKFEGRSYICTYLGKCNFPDKEVKANYICDKWEKKK